MRCRLRGLPFDQLSSATNTTHSMGLWLYSGSSDGDENVIYELLMYIKQTNGQTVPPKVR